MSADPHNPFWDFSLVVYPRPGVVEACLALQDRLGLDVNLLLFCCWAGSLGWRLEAPDMVRLTEEVAEWQRDVIGPLRGVRRRLKGPSDEATGDVAALRRVVKDCELEAERIEQAMLHAALAELPRALPCSGRPSRLRCGQLVRLSRTFRRRGRDRRPGGSRSAAARRLRRSHARGGSAPVAALKLTGLWAGAGSSAAVRQGCQVRPARPSAAPRRSPGRRGRAPGPQSGRPFRPDWPGGRRRPGRAAR